MAELIRRRHQSNPRAYAREILGVDWTDHQAAVATALIRHRRVFVRASHSVGKTHLAGGLVNWFIDTFGPCLVLTTAPTAAQVVDMTWKEIRVQRRGRPGLQPKAPRIELAPNWFAAGYTAQSAAAFQGRHEERMLIVFDEAVGVDGVFWDAAEGMMTGPECYWLAIMNPTDTSSRAYAEDQSGSWHVMTLSALDHPNIEAELRGDIPPFPAAVRLGWVRERLDRWCDPIPASDALVTDIEFDGEWYRPGPLFESRVMGRWPSQAVNAVWSDSLWQATMVTLSAIGALQIGCDVARFGDDYTSIVVRRGNSAIHHETHNGWSTSQTAGRLKQLAEQFDPGRGRGVPILIDDDGVGGGVVDQADGYRFLPVRASSAANDPEAYPNRRSELWFDVADRARQGLVDLSRLPESTRAQLRSQAMAPTWRVDSAGRRIVESKDATKKRLKRSPDDMDALNLAFAPANQGLVSLASRFGI